MFTNGLKKAIAAACMVGALMSPMAVMASDSPTTAETYTDLQEAGVISNVVIEDGVVVSFDVEDANAIKDGFQYFNLGDETPTKVFIKDGKYVESVSESANFLERMYNTTLDRSYDEVGMDWWLDQMGSEGKAGADVVDGFLGSDEYAKKGKTNEEILVDFYAAMFDREPDEVGKAYWMARLDAGMSIDALVAGFSESEEFEKVCEKLNVEPGTFKATKWADQNYERTRFAQGLYQNVLGRGSDEVGLEYWCEKLGTGMTGSEVAAGFIFSDENAAKELSNEEFVQVLYRTFCAREGEAEGVAYWVGLLENGASQKAVFNGFVESAEFVERCAVAQILPGGPIAE